MKDEKREPNHLVTICNQIYLPPQNLFPPSSSNLLKHPLHLSKASIPVFFFFFGTSGRSDRTVVSLDTLQPTIDVTDVSYTCYTWGSPSKRVNSRLASSDYRKGMSILVVAPTGFRRSFDLAGNVWKLLVDWTVGWLKVGGVITSLLYRNGTHFLGDQSWCKMYEVKFFVGFPKDHSALCVGLVSYNDPWIGRLRLWQPRLVLVLGT